MALCVYLFFCSQSTASGSSPVASALKFCGGNPPAWVAQLADVEATPDTYPARFRTRQ